MNTQKIYLIGAGGVGSWLLPSLRKLVPGFHIIVVDGDRLEQKNLDRQLFSDEDIGRNKAEALAERYGCDAVPEWFAEHKFEYTGFDEWLIVCVDNHAARAAALAEADRHNLKVIIAANETHSADAYVYVGAWKGMPIDPRVYFPDILTDKGGDPRAASIGCTGESQAQNPQLVTSNMMAAALAGHMFALWQLHTGEGSEDTYKFPYRFACTITRMQYERICDKMTPQEYQRKPNE